MFMNLLFCNSCKHKEKDPSCFPCWDCKGGRHYERKEVKKMSGPEYKTLAKAKIQDKRNLVISKKTSANIFGSYVLGQQIVIQEGQKQTTIFLKGAIHIDGLEALYNLRDALNEAITIEEDKNI